MKIDNSQLKLFQFCPDAYREHYVVGIERDWSKTDSAGSHGFGKRVHQLLEHHFKQLAGVAMELPGPEFPAIEDEAQALLAAYVAHYPTEDFDVLDIERTFEVPLPYVGCISCRHQRELHEEVGPYDVCSVVGCGCECYQDNHTYTGKFDVVGRRHRDGRLFILDHKTERRGSRDNDPEAWAARTQGTYYLWAAEQLYGEAPAALDVDVLTRRSPAGRILPTFRRDEITRDNEQISAAVRDLMWWAGQIEKCRAEFPRGPWPQNRNNCIVDGWKRCEYAPLHIVGRTDELIQLKYRPTEAYLDIT